MFLLKKNQVEPLKKKKKAFTALRVSIKLFTDAKERPQDFKSEYLGSDPSPTTY